MSQSDIPKKRVAIVGGGPGGLLTAYYLERYGNGQLEITIFEASNRVGGKVLSPKLPLTGFVYEAGVAEIYDYSQLGPDPLKTLITELGLTTKPMDGEVVVFEGQILRDEDDVRRQLGATSADCLDRLAHDARLAFTPENYYQSDWQHGRHDASTRDTFAHLLDQLGDDRVRRFVETVVHSDLATQPHKTSAAYGLQNWLMNEPDYMQLYSVVGGNERIVHELAKKLLAEIQLNARISQIITREDAIYDLVWESNSKPNRKPFEHVVMALPIAALAQITFVGSSLDQAIRGHIRHYDHPAHYLRVTVAFKTPFWRKAISGSFFMIDAFGGACVYDESSRSSSSHAVLSWLLAGDSAMTLGNTSDAEILSAILESLPEPIRPKKNQVIETKIHRWMGAVNAWPMGSPIREPDSRHMPDELGHPDFYIVGDYLFDSTVNGVMDSADTVAQLLLDLDLDQSGGEEITNLNNGDIAMTIMQRSISYGPRPSADRAFIRHFAHPESEYACDSTTTQFGKISDGLQLSVGAAEWTTSQSQKITVMQAGVQVTWAMGITNIVASEEKAKQFIPAVLDFDHLQREKAKFETILDLYEAQAKDDVKLTYAIERNRGVDRRRLLDVMEELARQRLRMARCLPLAEVAQPDLSEPARRLYMQLCENSQISTWLAIASDRMEALEDLYEGAIDRNNDQQAWKKSNAMEVAIIVLLFLETLVVLAQLFGFQFSNLHF